MSQVSTFVMFQGEAQRAIDLYSQVFERFRLMQVQHYDPTPDGRRLIKHASIDFDRQNLVFTDSPISHDFSFTPAVSLFINLPNEEALEQAFHRLAEGGKVLMPLDDYGFSARFGWLNDRFGLSWQLNVPAGICPEAKGSAQRHGSSCCCFICLSPGQRLCRGEFRQHHGKVRID